MKTILIYTLRQEKAKRTKFGLFELLENEYKKMIWMECLESHICSGYRLCFCFYKCPICSEDAVYFFLILCTSSEVFIPRHNKQVR
jgi:hypothetical protein